MWVAIFPTTGSQLELRIEKLTSETVILRAGFDPLLLQIYIARNSSRLLENWEVLRREKRKMRTLRGVAYIGVLYPPIMFPEREIH